VRQNSRSSGLTDRQGRSRLVHAFLAAAITSTVVGCSGGLSEKSFDSDTGNWVLFTQSRLLPFQGARQAEVFGFTLTRAPIELTSWNAVRGSTTSTKRTSGGLGAQLMGATKGSDGSASSTTSNS